MESKNKSLKLKTMLRYFTSSTKLLRVSLNDLLLYIGVEFPEKSVKELIIYNDWQFLYNMLYYDVARNLVILFKAPNLS